MKAVILHIIFFSYIFVLPLTSQDEKSLKLDFFDDFSTYKSFPSMCVDDVYEDSTGKLWLRTCGGAKQLSAYLYSFDGYEFSLAKGKISEIGKDISISGIIGDNLYGVENHEGGHKFFTQNLISDNYELIDSTQSSNRIVQDFKGDTLYTYIEFADRYELRLRSKNKTKKYQIKKSETCHDKEYGLEPLFIDYQIWVWNDKNETFCQTDFRTGEQNNLILQSITEKLTQKNVKGPLHASTFFGYYLTKYNLQDNEKIRLYQQLILKENPIRFTLPSKQQVTIGVFQDQKGQILFVEEIDGKQSATLYLKDNTKLDLSNLLSSLSFKGIRNIVSQDFLNEMHICNENGFSILNAKQGDAFEPIHLGFSTRTLTELPDKRVLINTQQERQWQYDVNSKEANLFEGEDCSILSNYFIKRSETEYWSSSRNEFIRYNASINSCKTFPVDTDGIRIFEMIDDTRIIYATSDNILNLFDIPTGSSVPLIFNDQPVKLESTILDLYIDQAGIIWLATVNGLYKVDIANQDIQNLNSLIPNFNFRFLCIEQDQSGKLWLGTSLSGLIILDPSTQEFIQLSSTNGLCNNTLVTITKDKNNSYWLGTFNGIAMVSDQGELISNFFTEDGIVENECNRHSASLLSDGRIAIGSVQGFTIINPNKINQSRKRKANVKVFLTQASFFDKRTNEVITAKQSLSNLKQIVLPAQNKNLQLKFATSNYTKPLENKYAYRFGNNNDWIDIGVQNELDFKELPSGRYKLQIRGSDHKGNWSQNLIELDIIAKNFFYQSPWFYLLLGLSIIGMGLIWIYSLRGQVDRATKQIRSDKEVIEHQADKLKELDEAKSRFFTNISHEFRTPLTIIKGMVEQIKEKPEVHLDNGAKMIERNTDDLLNLVNQIMDLRKLESNELKLNLIQSDVIHYLQLISESYTNLAAHKGIALEFHSNAEALIMDFDAEKLLRIISNLLSNAIKFTPSGGKIYLRVDQINLGDSQQLQIQVEDTGIGMQKDSLPSIFDRFYQEKSIAESEKGTGIGLALTKALVTLMEGNIQVESILGKGSTFTLFLLIRRTSMKREADKILMPRQQEVDSSKLVSTIPPLQLIHANKPRILIAEDNLDLQQYFLSALEDYYQVDLADNGNIGIQKAIDQIPDLIITDVMMPIKDGFELTDTLKHDERTDHIPIIILTAKDDIESKISGLSKGADAYLAKPFEKRELLVRIEKLLELRKKLQERYTKRNAKSDEAIVIEDPFLQKLHNYIEEHLSDAELNMDQITQAMAMSRTQVFRKLKALTGQSASSFIRSIRLKKSKELLRTTNLNVSEVAYEVGFTSLSYFSTAFMEEFGVRPTEYRK